MSNYPEQNIGPSLPFGRSGISVRYTRAASTGSSPGLTVCAEAMLRHVELQMTSCLLKESGIPLSCHSVMSFRGLRHTLTWLPQGVSTYMYAMSIQFCLCLND